ncbi:MAG: DegT/DnrJ/EryC1/StrS family aminotransferase [Coriobacteriia bacterium]|nr:DegT/DnrJ/EryC1/StrS family aminotransferase [Coriobacteriia bacterium]
MGVPLLDLTLQYTQLKEESDALWFDVMSKAAYIGGSRVEQLEEEIAQYCGVNYCVACANGTDALFLILEALGIGRGDEVITTPWTFFATLECIVHVGATPVLVDIEPGTYNIDPALIEAHISGRTKAIMPVHIYGQCVDMDALNDIAQRHDLVIIEDACQAIGATYKGKRAGSLGRAAAFSFFPTKNLGGAGDGGCITTDDKELADRMRLVARHGEASKYLHTTFGVNSRLDALQAGLLSLRLAKLDEWNNQRREAAAYYRQHLAAITELELPVERDWGKMVYHLFVLKSARAPEIVAYLQQQGIGSALYYPKSLHEQDVLLKVPGFVRPSLPVAEDSASKTFALPCYPGITREQQDEVIAALGAFFAS